MSTHTGRWAAGTPSWIDLATPDVTAAAAFYGSFLPWHFGPPSDAFGGYVMAAVDDRPAGGIGPLQFEGMPSAWTMYFASDDAEATQDAVVRNGGSVVLPVADIADLGRLLVATDPTGAAFGVWEANTHAGIGFTGEPGCLAWEDLRSTDPDTARAFYVEVFGFVYAPIPDAGPDYTTFALPSAPDHPLGGMGGMMGTGDRSAWTVYFAVEEVAAAVTAAESAGGRVVAPPFDSPYGTMCALIDPNGAGFWLFQDTSGG